MQCLLQPRTQRNWDECDHMTLYFRTAADAMDALADVGYRCAMHNLSCLTMKDRVAAKHFRNHYYLPNMAIIDEMEQSGLRIEDVARKIISRFPCSAEPFEPVRLSDNVVSISSEIKHDILRFKGTLDKEQRELFLLILSNLNCGVNNFHDAPTLQNQCSAEEGYC